MRQPQHLECDTPNCIHWKNGECIKETSVTIQKHHCVDYEERIIPPAAAVTIEVSGGLVQNVYASPDLPEIHIELIDMDELENESEETRSHKKHLLDTITQTHKHIF